MTDVQAALFGAFIGALAGLAGGGFTALAALRASQLAARTPLGSILHAIANTLIQIRVAAGASSRIEALRDFERKWNEFAVNQRILCPSRRIEALSSLLLAAARNEKEDPDHLLLLAGQTLEKVTRMVAAHSSHLFRWQASREESKVIRTWLQAPESQVLGEHVRAKLQELTR